MRAVWIATVNNIDFPPSNEYEPYRQQERLIEILDTLKSININTVIFQIRPTADAFYHSLFEPYSRFFTGTQGRWPEPYYDFLEFLIQQSHSRAIDVHVWINPYRLLNSDDLDLLHHNNIYFEKPEMFIKYGKQYFFNPAKQETLNYLENIVEDIVVKYDIDALHIDDYFYPYPISGEKFPDKADFESSPRGFDKIEDWRRDNVNRAIDVIYSTVKKHKPWVEFGVSPFAVWRNKSKDARGSNTRALSNYDDLYADILKWIDEDKVDYVMPQLYLEIGHKYADYATMVKWWSENTKNANLHIGLFASNLNNPSASKAWQTGNELAREMELNKNFDKIDGVALYSAVAIMENRAGIKDTLKNHFFKNIALIPTSAKHVGINVDNNINPKIYFDNAKQKIFLTWNEIPSDKKYFVVYFSKSNGGINSSNPENILAVENTNCLDITKVVLSNLETNLKFSVSFINKHNVESILSKEVSLY